MKNNRAEMYTLCIQHDLDNLKVWLEMLISEKSPLWMDEGENIKKRI